ncbi:MAG: hypothetical protein GY777_20210 [Candidatus Brocadiaceae bacterium]|nr:hypothetical protein [Candidatus Brocadiaceae bacterium]
MKYLPPEMSDWYFPFNWDVNAIWNLEGSIEQRGIKELGWHLEKPFWSSERGKGMLFDLKPGDVLANPDKSFYHSTRIKNADVSYPVCLTTYKGIEIIIDGIHRLAKLASDGVQTIEVKVINEKSIESIAKYA